MAETTRVYQLAEQVEGYENGAGRRVADAANFATEVHASALRRDGRPYVQHCLAVGEILAGWRAPSSVIVAGVLHDCRKQSLSSLSSLEPIRRRFGAKIAGLVDEVTRLSRLASPESIPAGMEENRRLLPWISALLAREEMAVVIKLADRLEIAGSLGALKPSQRVRFAQGIQRVFVPLADRLGIRIVRRQLEDVAFELLHPSDHRAVKERLDGSKDAAAEALLCSRLESELTTHGLEARLLVPAVGVSEAYRLESEEVASVPPHVAHPLLVELETEDALQCFSALGLVHRLWTPLRGRLLDYVSSPRPNGYRAVHTRVRTGEGEAVVVIQTKQMRLVSERGILCRWLGLPEELLPKQPGWVAPKSGEIAVFSKNGDVYVLPEGATAIDFAYKVHRSLGHQMTGVHVNFRPAPSDQALRTGDVVRILTSGVSTGPSAHWLKKAVTSRARSEIRRWLKARSPESAESLGWSVVDKRLRQRGYTLRAPQVADEVDKLGRELGYPTFTELLLDVGLGRRDPEDVARHFDVDGESRSGQIVASVVALDRADLPHRLAGCCQPVPPDEIVGYVTSDDVVSIHKRACGVARRQSPLVSAEWASTRTEMHSELRITGVDRIGLVADVSNVLTDARIGMTSFHAEQMRDGSAELLIGLDKVHRPALRAVLKRMEAVPGVESVFVAAPAGSAGSWEGSVADRRFRNRFNLFPAEGESFFGRKAELKELLDNLRGVEPGRAVLVWGPKRIGKTSLLLQFKRVLGTEDHLPVYVNMLKMSGRSTVAFLHYLMQLIAEEAGEEALRQPRRQRMERDPSGYFQSFVESGLVRFQKPVVLLLDEFQLVNTLREDDLQLERVHYYLRSLIQEKIGMSFIFSGGGALSSLLEEGKATPLLEVSLHQELRRLKRSDARDLIVEVAPSEAFSQDAVSRILNFTDSHPFYVQILCGELLKRFKRGGARTLDLVDVDKVIATWFVEQGAQFFEHFWGVGTSAGRTERILSKVLLTAIAKEGDGEGWAGPLDAIKDRLEGISAGQFAKGVAFLKEIRSIEGGSDAKVRISVPAVREWLLANASMEELLYELEGTSNGA